MWCESHRETHIMAMGAPGSSWFPLAVHKQLKAWTDAASALLIDAYMGPGNKACPSTHSTAEAPGGFFGNIKICIRKFRSR